MGKVDIADQAEVDIRMLLQVTKYLKVVVGDVGQRGQGECRTSAGDISPRAAAVLIDQHGSKTGLGQIAEHRRARHTASCNESTHLAAVGNSPGRQDNLLSPGLVDDIAQLHETGHRRTGGEVTGHLYAVGA